MTDGTVCVEIFQDWLTRGPDSPWWYADGADRHTRIHRHLPHLAGCDLACWCPLPPPGQPDICHGAVLLTLANRPTGRDAA